MPIVPAIADDFNHPSGEWKNYDSLIGEVQSMPTNTTNIFSISPFGVSKIDQILFNKHINVRSFDTTITNIARTQSDLSRLHQVENAHIQTIIPSATPTAGTFDVRWYREDGTFASATLAHNVTVAQFQAAIDGLIGAGNATVTGTGGTFPFIVTFRNDIPHLVTLKFVSFLTASAVSVQILLQIGDPHKPDTLWLQTADPLDPSLSQAAVETKQTIAGETWEISADSSGYTSVGNLLVGKLPAYRNWRAAQILLSNATIPFDVKLVSRRKNIPIDFTSLGDIPNNIDISFVLPNFPITLVDTSNSWFQLTSDPQGKFADEGGSGQDTSQLIFTSDVFSPSSSTTYFFRKDIVKIINPSATTPQDFLNARWTDQANMDWTRVTAVRIRFKGNSTVPSGQIITIMGMVAATNSSTFGHWFPFTFDIDTSAGRLYVPINTTANIGLRNITPPLLRSANPPSAATDDPRPSDIALDISFQTGDLLTTGSFNRIQLIARENETGPNDTSFLVGELIFNKTDIKLHRYAIQRHVTSTQVIDTNMTVTSLGLPSTITVSKNGDTPAPGVLAPLLPNTKYKFEMEVLANGMRCAVYLLDNSGAVKSTHYDTDFVFNAGFERRAGRVGYWTDFLDYDVYVDSFDTQSEVFSILRTKQFPSHTPIDGAQLFIEGSTTIDQFNGFVSLDPFDTVQSDQQRTLSGNSTRFVPGDRTVDRLSGMAAGKFEIADWRHMQLSFDIWVPQSLTSSDSMRPAVYFKDSDGDPYSIAGTIGPLDLNMIPNVWTHNTLDLSRLDKQPTGEFFLWIMSQKLPTDSWWIDNVKLDRLAIDCQIRAIEDGEWISFGRMLNDRKLALHLPPEQRGKAIQLQIKSLVQDAWISSYRLEPHYAELGRLIPQPKVVFENHVTYGYSDPSQSFEEYAPAVERPILVGRGFCSGKEEFTTHNL
jgi:hypothetical protein